jgi:peptidoglycan hydrolase-like protein with peptidoglycan-binding domain
MVTYDETTATLGFTGSATVTSPAAGTVTSILGEGAAIEAGTVVATVDGAPIVALIGDVPGWRDLSSDSSDGVDVRQLETNLVALGFDPDGDISIDEEFDSATQDAVEAWEESLGLEVDGEVPQSRVVFVPGQLVVDDVDVVVGSAASSGGSLLTGRLAERLFPVTAEGPGSITGLAPPKIAVTTGTVLFLRDHLPVVAIEGDVSDVAALERALSVGVDDGTDVEILEEFLVSAGFTADGALVVDDKFDVATATAVLAWWQSIDPAISVAPEALVVPAGGFVVVAGGLEVGRAVVAEGATIGADAVVLNLTAPARMVTTTAPIDDETFALGATVDVEFPDGTVGPGTIVDVGTTATNDTGTPGAVPTVPVSLRVDEIPAAYDEFLSIPVTLRVVDQSEQGALVVPPTALVALAEGGYALEVVDTPGTADTAAVTHLVAVEPGLYADGFVVVTGPEVTEGLEVVVPS